MRSDTAGQANETERRQETTPITVSIRLGCEIEKEIYRSRGRGRMTLTQYETWQETFIVPEEGYNKINLTCPICHSSFEVRVYSKSKARLRKLCFATCFLTIAACGIVLGVLARSEKGFMGYSLAAPFICFTVWQLLDVIRGRFDASDVVSHARGKVHRILDGGEAFRKGGGNEYVAYSMLIWHNRWLAIISRGTTPSSATLPCNVFIDTSPQAN